MRIPPKDPHKSSCGHSDRMSWCPWNSSLSQVLSMEGHLALLPELGLPVLGHRGKRAPQGDSQRAVGLAKGSTLVMASECCTGSLLI